MLHPGLIPANVVSSEGVNQREQIPEVTSVNAALPAGLYKKGFRNPRTGRLAAIKRSLTRAIMLAKIGVEQLVPSTRFPYMHVDQ